MNPETTTAAELLDRVDDHNRVIGQVERSQVHGNPGLQHRAVHVFVRNRAGAIFLQQRALTKEIQPGRWDTSVGGHVGAGEAYSGAACRELAEELGRRVVASELDQLHDYVWGTDVETEHVRTFALLDEGPFVLHPDEIAAGRFWSNDELRAAIGSGQLTPNLEHELDLLGLAW